MLNPQRFEQSEAIRTVESGFAGRRDRTARERVLLGGTTIDASTRLTAFLSIKPDWDILVFQLNAATIVIVGPSFKE